MDPAGNFALVVVTVFSLFALLVGPIAYFAITVKDWILDRSASRSGRAIRPLNRPEAEGSEDLGEIRTDDEQRAA